MILIDGKKISLELQSEIAVEVKELIANGKSNLIWQQFWLVMTLRLKPM